MSNTSNITSISDMSDTPIGKELIYDTSAVSQLLGIQESTLRKYCTLMRKYHYKFNKNAVGHRIFYKRDIEIIQKIIDFKNTGVLTLNQAVKTILTSDIDDIDDIDAVTSVKPLSNPEYKQLLEELSRFKQEQMDINQTLLNQFQTQQIYIKNSIEERDRKLMFAIKESIETRRQLTVVTEAIEVGKKPWWRFW